MYEDMKRWGRFVRRHERRMERHGFGHDHGEHEEGFDGPPFPPGVNPFERGVPFGMRPPFGPEALRMAAAHFGHGGHGGHRGGPFGPGGGGEFGARRPLRFLAHRLELDEQQTSELHRILEDLKTERAQAEVDWRRTQAAFADAIGAEAFDATRAEEAGKLRVQSAERQRDATRAALTKLHAILRPEQRQTLADLIRAGALAL